MKHRSSIAGIRHRTKDRIKKVHSHVQYRLNKLAQVALGILWFILNFFLFPYHALGQTFPSPVGYVNDFAEIISSESETQLGDRLRTYDEQTGNEIAVATIRNLDGYAIDDYAVRLFEKWRVGKEKQDNGVLFLIAKEDRKVRIEVGYGLEPVLTDGEAGSIIRNVIAPSFRENNYDKGVKDGVEALISGIGSDENDLDQAVGNNPIRDIGGAEIDNLVKQLGEFVMFIPFMAVYLFSYMARTKDITLGGVMGGVGGLGLGLLLGNTAALLGFAIGGGIFGLILDWILSRNYKAVSRSGGATDWFHTYGGFGGSRGFGGGGFGGFGGGRSGGGGSSGGW